MNILITGGAGFIGSHLADALLKRNCTVSIIDNLSSGKEENIPQEATFHNTDITDFEAVDTIIKSERPDAIFHLAAQINVRSSIEDPLFDAKTNILASVNILNSAQKMDIQKVIFSSTGGVMYGDTEIRPTPETHKEQPICPYAINKLSIEKYLYYYHEVHKMNTVALRFGNVYGPRQNPHGEAGVISIFLDKMLRGETPTINGNGVQTRDYVFVHDVVEACLLALENTHATGVYNIGTEVETNVNTLFALLNSHFENAFKEDRGPQIIGEQMTSCLDIKKAQNEFDWKPNTPLSEGIEKTYEWFKKQYKQSAS